MLPVVFLTRIFSVSILSGNSVLLYAERIAPLKPKVGSVCSSAETKYQGSVPNQSLFSWGFSVKTNCSMRASDINVTNAGSKFKNCGGEEERVVRGAAKNTWHKIFVLELAVLELSKSSTPSFSPATLWKSVQRQRV